MPLLLSILLQAAVVSQSAPVPAPFPSSVRPPPRVVIGQTVTSADGGVVGTVVAADADNVVVDAGSTRLPFPRSSLRRSFSGGLALSMTRSQLAAATSERERMVASSRASLLKVGTSVIGGDDAPIGVVSNVEPGFLVIDIARSGSVKIPEHSFIGAGDVLVMAQTRSQLVALIGRR